MIIRVTGLQGVRSFINRLPKNLKKYGKEGVVEVVNSLQKRIIYRFRATGYGTRGSSGKARKFITKGITKNGGIVNISSYPALIEGGVRSHWVSIKTIKQHMRSPGSTIGKRQPKGTKFQGHPVFWYYKGPFVKPALESMQKDTERIMIRGVENAINKSMGGK